MNRRELLAKLGIGAASMPLVSLLAKGASAQPTPCPVQPPTLSGKAVMGVDQRGSGLDFYVIRHDNDKGTGGYIPGYIGSCHRDSFRHLDSLMNTYQIHHCVIDADPRSMQASWFASRFPGYVSLCRFRNTKAPVLKTTGYTRDNTGSFVVPLVYANRDHWYGNTGRTMPQAYCHIARALLNGNT